MKKLILTALTCVVMLAAAAPVGANTKMVRLTKFEGQTITGLDVSNHFKVDVAQSDRASAVVEIPSELESRLTFELRDGVLHLSLDLNGLNDNPRDNKRFNELVQNIRATVTVTGLNSVSAFSHTHVTCNGEFNATGDAVVKLNSHCSLQGLTLVGSSSLDVRASSHCNITNLNVDTPVLRVESNTHSHIRHIVHNGDQSEVRINTHSSIVIWGTVNSAKVNVDSHCQYHGFDYFIKDLDVDVRSHSSTNVAVSDNLYANMDSHSHVHYKGEPAVRRLNIGQHSSINKR